MPVEVPGSTILVIDDNATNLGVLTGYLRQHGFQIMIARTGRDGLEKARLGQPDLILLDVRMPGMDGFETCQQLKAAPETQEIPVIFITALQSLEDKVKGFAAGGVDYITKPLQEEEVMARVKTHVQIQTQKNQLQRQIAAGQRQETALRESETRYRALLEKLPDAVFIHDSAGKLVEVNDEACRRLGYSREELLQKHPRDFTQEKPQKGYAFVLKQLHAQGSALEDSVHITKTGERIPCEIAMSLIQYQDQTMVLSISRDITERKQIEEDLRASERTARAILNNSAFFAILTDRDGKILDLNETAALELGLSVEKALGRCAWDFLAPEVAASRISAIARVVETGQPVRWEDVSSGKHFENSVSPVADEDGKVRRLVVFGADITGYKQAEAALRESEKRYQSLFNDPPVSLWQEDFSQIKQEIELLKRQGVTDVRAYLAQHPECVAKFATLVKLIDVNQAALDLHQAGSREELLAGLGTLFSDEAWPVFREEIAALAEGATRFEGEFVEYTLAGTKINVAVSLSVVPGCEQTWSKVLVSAIDITARKQAETKLNDSERQYRTLAENSGTSILIIDRSGVYQFLNHKAAEAFGGLPADFIGKSIFDLFPSAQAEEILAENRKVIDTGVGRTYEQTYELATGQKTFLVNDQAIQNAQGQGVALQSSSIDVTTRKQTEDALREIQGRYRELIENMAEGAGLIDENGRFVFANPAAELIFGIAPGSLPGRSLDEFFNPEQVTLLSAQAERQRAGSKNHIELEITRPDGERRWLRVAATPRFAGPEQYSGVFGVFHDITAEKQAEAALRESETRLRTIFDASQTGILLVDPRGTITFANQRMASLFKCALPDLLGSTYASHIHPDEKENGDQKMQQLIAGEVDSVALERHYLCADGSDFWGLLSGRRQETEDGQLVSLVGSIADITDLKQAEKQLQESQLQLEAQNLELRKLSLAIEQSGNTVVITDTNGVIQYANPRFEETTGYTLAEALGQNPRVLKSGEQGAEFYQVLWKTIASGQVWHGEFHNQRKDGTLYWESATIAPVEDNAGQVTHYIAIKEEISARKEVEETLRKSQDRYRRLVDNAPIGIVSINAQGQVVDVNPKMVEILGSPSAEATKTINILTFPPSVEAKIAEDFQHCLETGENSVTERFYQTAWGKAVQIQIHATPVKDLDGAITGVQAVVEDITTRKQAEKQKQAALEELRQEYRRLDDIIDFLPDATLVVDRQGRVIAWNRAMEIMTGVSKIDMLGKSNQEYSLPFYGEKRPILIDLALLPDQDFEEAHYQQIQRKGDLLFAEAQTPHIYNGRGASLLGTATRLRNAAGELIGAIESIRDITELKQTAETLRQSEAKFRSVIEQSRDGFLLTDESGIIIEWNDAQSQITGLSREAALGMPIWDIQFRFTVPERRTPELYEHLSTTLAKAYETKDAPWLGRPGENEIELPDGRRRIIQTLAYKIMVGETFRIANFTHDITERKQAEEALRTSETKFRWLAENVHDIIWLIDRDMRFTYVSPAVTRILGFTPEEALHLSLQDNLTPDSFELIRQSQALHAETPRQPGKVSRLEVQQYHKNGSLVWMEILTQSMLDEQGRQIGYLGVSRNIDERKEYEKQLQQAKEAAEAANRAKSAFIANMSHELRTPLNAILGFSEFISRAENLTASQRDNLVLINQSGEHLLQIINDILEISKIEAGRTTLQEDRFDLPSLIQNIESLLELRASQQNITLAFHLSPNTPRYVYTDQNKLRQILMNLLSNAIKFSPNGQVSLTTRVDPANHKRLFFTIEDTGVGIAPDEIEMLFTAFAQTSSGKKIQQGTGLGLAISRAFVQLMGGEITVRSRVGQGSCFEFNILVSPLSKEETTPLLAAQQTRALGLEPGQQAVDGGPYRILIVEDVAANRLLMESVLRLLGQPVGGEASAANGLEVRSVSNGQEAVEMWEAWRPHLIWMDIWMPVMDGAEATRQIKARPEGRSTVIIALTAAAFEEDRLQALSAGFDGFVRKPFREKTIVSTLVEHLSLRFVYEAPARQTASKTSPLSLPSPEEVLPSLPAAWLTEMQQALTQGEVKWLRQLADQIQPQAPALAEKLARLIENFELDEISALLQTLSTR